MRAREVTREVKNWLDLHIGLIHNKWTLATLIEAASKHWIKKEGVTVRARKEPEAGNKLLFLLSFHKSNPEECVFSMNSWYISEMNTLQREAGRTEQKKPDVHIRRANGEIQIFVRLATRITTKFLGATQRLLCGKHMLACITILFQRHFLRSGEVPLKARN